MNSPTTNEKPDLQHLPYNKAPAFQLAYGTGPNHPKRTTELDIGDQQRFIDAAERAIKRDGPLNTLLTLRLDAFDGPTLFYSKDGPLGIIKPLMEKLRKWLRRNDAPLHYIWVREASEGDGEHWHLGIHVPPKLRSKFVTFIAQKLDRPSATTPKAQRVLGELARSWDGAWQVSQALPNPMEPFQGHGIAAYLGKGAPSERIFRGTWVANDKKPIKGEDYGGAARFNKYDHNQGEIIGTQTRKYRADIARCLKD